MTDTNKQTSAYIIADHIKTACFMIADGVLPSGKQRGYVLRRLIRRSLSASLKLNIDLSQKTYFSDLVESVIGIYESVYLELSENREKIVDLLFAESQKYQKSIAVGVKEWSKLQPATLTGEKLSEITWNLYQTHGVPIEVSQDILENQNLTLDLNNLNQLIESHQKLSQSSSAGQFKSGLGAESAKTRRLHTATHILHQQLREIFGPEVRQMGSAITDQKARFDFTLDKPLEAIELEKLTQQIQAIIDLNLQMQKITTTAKEAQEMGAIGLFGEKYGQEVTVYSLVDNSGKHYSMEFCAGPHVTSSGEIGKFKILKQKSIGQGLRRLEFDVE